MKNRFKIQSLFAGVVSIVVVGGVAFGGTSRGYLETVHRHVTLTSTIADNGDTNPYALVVAPVSAGKIHAGDVLVDNFNNLSNLQGTGTTIVDFNPATRRLSSFASLPRQLPGCPGGVGLTTAMTMLQSGWVIVGSTPSTDGTTKTKGPGGLIVLDPTGKVAAVWQGPNINDPWGNMAVIDRGRSATLLVSMAGFDVPGPEVTNASGMSVTVNKATILRIQLDIRPGRPPVISNETVIADGLAERADRDAFLIGPTGLAIDASGTLYASDALGNRIIAISDAATRTTSAGQGRTVTQGKLLHHPLALIQLPDGDLLTCNGLNGEVVEVNPRTGKQIYGQWIDADQAQSPPGNGDLFGLAVAPDGTGFYYVEDDMNMLMEATR